MGEFSDCPYPAGGIVFAGCWGGVWRGTWKMLEIVAIVGAVLLGLLLIFLVYRSARTYDAGAHATFITTKNGDFYGALRAPMTKPELWLAQWLFYGYVVSRLLHFLAYVTAQLHDIRATFWTIGSVIIIYMTVATLLKALGY
jgi:hypothetical protein